VSSNVKVLRVVTALPAVCSIHATSSQAKINCNITAPPPGGGPVHAVVWQFSARLHVVQNYGLLDMMPLLIGNWLLLFWT